MEDKYKYFELLYVYIGDIGRCFYNQEFNFSTEYIISYNKENKKLTIEKTNNKDYLNNFFGENISNINLVVGKNGSGKSTLFDLLGNLNSSSNIDYDDDYEEKGWFAVYKTNIQNNFYVEGDNNKLLEISDKTGYTKFHYSAIIKYDFNKQSFDVMNLCSQFDKCFHVFYNKKNLSSPYHLKNFTTKTEDFVSLLLRRKYIQNKNFSDLYYLTTKNKDFINHINLDDLSLQMIIGHDLEPSHSEIFDRTMEQLEDIYINDENLTIKENIECLILFNEINSIFKGLIAIGANQDTFIKKMSNILDTKSDFLERLREIFSITCFYLDSINGGGISFYYDKFIFSLIEQIHALPDNYISYFDNKKSIRFFIDEDIKSNKSHLLYQIKIPLKEVHNPNIHYFLKVYDKGNITEKNDRDITGDLKKEFGIHINRNISDGELQLLMTYAGIYYAIDQCSEMQESCLIILDEPEKGFHPEWISKFINGLVQLVKSISNKKIKYQFLISTHSPFMLSDIPKEFITTIDIQKDEDGNHIRVVDKPKQSFASNYYDIIKDSFFLDNTMGEFALDKIRNIHEILYDSLSQIKDNNPITKQQVLDELNQKVYILSEDNLLKIIDTIGEPLIRMQLHNLWNELNKQWSTNTSSFVKTLSNEEKEKLYNELKKDLNK